MTEHILDGKTGRRPGDTGSAHESGKIDTIMGQKR